MPDTRFTRNFVDTSYTTKKSLIIALVMFFLMSILLREAMSHLVSWINAMQLILHLPFINVKEPEPEEKEFLDGIEDKKDKEE